ncbi:AN1-type zinc finger protein 6 isoform X1 [Onthophagus taurus]|uniref:AN1-type zinc finger protein 6 isoform X1 n=1 Tax=Onthophagus taurus TaxID=166361 RepID=UPI000C205429|nr:AN1-type zinc finger protein 6 [Onthophagus taurus]XP_022919607.1 AN1-type zinc finger protein 6 [Onthophagus taurus]XP_022919608.1 AN1-type zinc finger protein 6 [Onthophagus taurus]XP_022919609.1 AN1-type zinc finger protein 6 [Onthophagus taurus]
MERESNPMQALCRSGCGFYGSPATDGLCSLCYKEALKKKQQPPVSAPSPVSSVNNAQSLSSLMETTTAQPTVPCLQTSISVSSTPTSSDSSNDDTIEDGAASGVATSLDATGGNSSDNGDKDGDKDAKKKKNRCATCRKKVGLTGFECRCGGLFCAVHRYSDKHDCSFNYREMGAQEIRRNNPVVVGEKIQKI